MTEHLILATLLTILAIHIMLTRRAARQLRRDILLITRGARQARGELLKSPRYKDLDS